jgi:predicted phosphoribosyltransferase
MNHGSNDELNVNRSGNISDIFELRNHTGIFRDREHAGKILSRILTSYRGSNAVVFGIPAGGVPVAAPIASQLGLDLDVAVVSKITLPWNTEAGYGAVAFDGTVQLNQEIISRMGLTTEEIQKGTEKASLKVERRFREFRGDKSFPDIKKRPAILVDDGIASGFTMLVAVEALKKRGASQIIIAAPTAHLQALEKVAPEVSEVYCVNIRGGWGFAVADAYQNWYDVDDEEVSAILKEFY